MHIRNKSIKACKILDNRISSFFMTSLFVLVKLAAPKCFSPAYVILMSELLSISSTLLRRLALQIVRSLLVFENTQILD